jgi:hypothetical protein
MGFIKYLKMYKFIIVFIFFCVFDIEGADATYKILPFEESALIDGLPKESVWDKLEFSDNFSPNDEKVKKYRSRFKAYANLETFLYILK